MPPPALAPAGGPRPCCRGRRPSAAPPRAAASLTCGRSSGSLSTVCSSSPAGCGAPLPNSSGSCSNRVAVGHRDHRLRSSLTSTCRVPSCQRATGRCSIEPDRRRVSGSSRVTLPADPGQLLERDPVSPSDINRKYSSILELRKHLEKGQPSVCTLPSLQHVTDDQPLARRHAEGTPAHRPRRRPAPGSTARRCRREADHQHGAEGEADLAQRRHARRGGPDDAGAAWARRARRFTVASGASPPAGRRDRRSAMPR